MCIAPKSNLPTDAFSTWTLMEASYLGCLLIDDNAFCRQIVELLLANRNKTIADIGSLDLSSTL
jgi:hypothetical protein